MTTVSGLWMNPKKISLQVGTFSQCHCMACMLNDLARSVFSSCVAPLGESFLQLIS